MTLYAVHLKSRDADDSADWWVRLVGCEVIERSERADGSLVIRLDAAGTTIAITQHEDAADLPEAPLGRHIGIEHFGLVVEELDALLEKMRANGVEIMTPPSPVPSGMRAFVQAPDRVMLELFEAAHG